MATEQQLANRAKLIAALRHLPDDWEWDYGRHCACGLGLAARLNIGNSNLWGILTSKEIAPLLGLTEAQSYTIFLCLGDDIGSGELREGEPVPPEMVARALGVERRCHDGPGRYRVHVREIELARLKDCADLVEPDTFAGDFMGIGE